MDPQALRRSRLFRSNPAAHRGRRTLLSVAMLSALASVAVQAEIFTWTGNVPVYFGGWVGGSVSAPAASKFARLRVTVTPAP